MIPSGTNFEEEYDEDMDSDVNFDFEQVPSLTYAMNVDRSTFIGKIDDVEAIKQAVMKIIYTERYEYEIYSWNYGMELQDLYGEDIPYVMSEVEQRIIDALTADDRIESVENFEIEDCGNGKLSIKFTVITVWGEEAEMESEMNIYV